MAASAVPDGPAGASKKQRYDMPTAVGNSLLIISLNSGVVLLARGGEGSFHWAVIVPFTLAAIVGSFAALLLLVAGYVLVRAGFGI